MTGSSRGLGAAVARDLTSRGARVVVNGTDPVRTESIARELESPAVIGSVADEEIAEQLVETCLSEFGGIELVVNNAGIVRDGMLTRQGADDFDEVISVHLRGTWLMCRAAARAMREAGGAIINVVSGTALYGNLGQSAYAAAKGGILGLTRSLALELQRSRISVNAIAPVARTDMVAPLLELDGGLGEVFGEPEDVAPLVALLAGPDASGLSGLVIGFNGRALTAWSHPAAEATVDVPRGAGLAGLREALGELPRLTPNPDQFGRAVHEALGVGS